MFFIYVQPFFFRGNDGVILFLAASTHIATERNAPGKHYGSVAVVHPHCRRIRQPCGESWNFYERPVSKFLTPRKIRYFSWRDRSARTSFRPDSRLQKFQYQERGDVVCIVCLYIPAAYIYGKNVKTPVRMKNARRISHGY